MVYYGKRFYSPQLGRFVNRDPAHEQGGANLYAFCGNDGINQFDVLGMYEEPPQATDAQQKEADEAARRAAAEAQKQAEAAARAEAIDKYGLLAYLGGKGQDTVARAGDTAYGMVINGAKTLAQLDPKSASSEQFAMQGKYNGLIDAGRFDLAAMTAIQAAAYTASVSEDTGNHSSFLDFDTSKAIGAMHDTSRDGPTSAANQATANPTPGFTTYNLNQRFTSATEAAIAAAKFMQGTIGAGLNSWEYGAGIYRQLSPTADGSHYEVGYYLTPITPGFVDSGNTEYWYSQGDPLSETMNPQFTHILYGDVAGATMVAWIHSHPNDEGNQRFSRGDLSFGQRFGLDAYLLTTQHGLRYESYQDVHSHDWPPTEAQKQGQPIDGVPLHF
jgi:hypothetical protein